MKRRAILGAALAGPVLAAAPARAAEDAPRNARPLRSITAQACWAMCPILPF